MRRAPLCALWLALPACALAAKVGEVPPLSLELRAGPRAVPAAGAGLSGPSLVSPGLQAGALQPGLLPPSVIPQASVSASPGAAVVAAPAAQTAQPMRPGVVRPALVQEEPARGRRILPGAKGQLDEAFQASAGDQGLLKARDEKARSAGSVVFDAGSKADRQASADPVFAGPSAAAGGLRTIFAAAQGAGRRDWSIGGRPATYLGGGGFKDILVHPDDPEALLTLFTQAGSNDAAGSRAERDRDLVRHRALAAQDLAPRVLGQGSLVVSQARGSRQVSYYVQERVHGKPLAEASAADLPLVRELFDRLVAARIKLTDRNQMLQNILVGRTRSQPGRRAIVVDAGEAEAVPPRGLMDRLAGRPDPLRQYYDGLLKEISPQLKPGR